MDNLEASTDSIGIKNLEIYLSVGVGEIERKIGQRLCLQIEVFLPLDKSGQTDELKYTISYVDISNLVKELSKGREYKLLEHFGRVIIEKIFLEFTKVEAVKILVEKKHVPDKDFLGESSFIRLFRTREQLKTS